MSLKTSLNCLVCLCLSCAVLAAAAAPAYAQAGGARADNLERPVKPEPRPLPADMLGVPLEPKPLTFDIDFRGGDLMALMKTIREQNGIMPNVIVHDEVRSTNVPPFSLAGVEFYELMEALGTLDIGLHIEMPTENVSTITRKRTTGPGIVEIYSLRRLLDPAGPLSYKMDDIATAIRTAWDMIADAGDPSMKVHQETGLLIVQGTKDEQIVAKTVLSRLSDQYDEVEHDLRGRYDKQIDQMKVAHQEELAKLQDKHARELEQAQRLFEMELKGREDEYRSLRDRHEQLLAEYEALKRGN